MTDAAKTHPLDAELGELWFDREKLDEWQWGRLYQIVREVLISYRPRELSGLAEERETHVLEFFEDKVFQRDARPSRVHVGALRGYYVNYLRDELKSAATLRKYFVHADVGESGRASQKPEAGDAWDPDSRDAWASDRAKAEPGKVRLHDDEFLPLTESGYTLAGISESAKSWLAGCEEWVPAYLAFHFAQDRELREPLVKLARRLGIKSYHSKAAKLGFNWNVDAAETRGRRFEDTLIGAWIMRDLGIRFTRENRGLVHAALKVLCYEALIWAETQEYRQ